MNNVTVICPYIMPSDIVRLKNLFGWEIKYLFLQDQGRIGSDLMYEKLWNQCGTDDIIIFHADMSPLDNDKTNEWYKDLLNFVQLYPEAGMFGCKLLYPQIHDGKYIIQSAGGWFNDKGIPQHYGSGLDLYSKQIWKELELDNGQYDFVREVAWTTFGGVYIRRAVLDQVGNFNREYEWTYNRDVDYCLRARQLGWKIYQVPVPLLHFESKDNKILKSASQAAAEHRNLQTLQQLWGNSPLSKTIDVKIS